MKVAIIGAGAVGQLTASFFAEAGMSVTLVARRQEQVNELQTHQLTRINMDGTKTKHMVMATTDLATLPPQNLIVIAVKYSHLQKLYQQIITLAHDTPLLFMQNGLAHFEEALALPHHNIAFCSVSFGARIAGQSTVQHSGIGSCKIAIARGQQRPFNSYFSYTIIYFLSNMLKTQSKCYLKKQS